MLQVQRAAQASGGGIKHHLRSNGRPSSQHAVSHPLQQCKGSAS